MARLWNEKDDLPWITNELEDAFSAHIGEYYLRVERLNGNLWWWDVSFRQESIPTTLKSTTDNMYRAIGLAEGVFTMHRMSYVRTSEIRFFKSSID